MRPKSFVLRAIICLLTDLTRDRSLLLNANPSVFHPAAAEHDDTRPRANPCARATASLLRLTKSLQRLAWTS